MGLLILLGIAVLVCAESVRQRRLMARQFGAETLEKIRRNGQTLPW